MSDLYNDGAYEFLKVWDILEEHINKKGYRWRNYNSFKVIKELSKIDGIEDIIKTLSIIGYELRTIKVDFTNYVYFLEKDSDIFKTLAEAELYKEYIVRFKALKSLGYEDIKSYKSSAKIQLGRLVKIAKIQGDVVGAIYVLASKGYKIDQATGIGKFDIQNLEKVAGEVDKEKSEGKNGVPIYLYEKGNLEVFQDYFESLGYDDKKLVLESILDYQPEEGRQETDGGVIIQKWLEENYLNLIKEVGFKNL